MHLNVLELSLRHTFSKGVECMCGRRQLEACCAARVIRTFKHGNGQTECTLATLIHIVYSRDQFVSVLYANIGIQYVHVCF